jgi:hypothetical protein
MEIMTVIKIGNSEAESIRVQKQLFKMGYYWTKGYTAPATNFINRYIYLNSDMQLRWCYYSEKDDTVLTTDEFLKQNKDWSFTIFNRYKISIKIRNI